MTRVRGLMLVALVLALATGIGCTRKEEPKVDPKVAPPTISEAGVLKAGVDLSTPPFAGVDGERKAGIDIDVAAALAERLGLTVTYVDVAPSDAATALAEGTVDIVLSVPYNSADVTRMSLAGTYLTDGPAVFTTREQSGSVEPSITLDTLPAGKIAVQDQSESFWILESELPTSTLQVTDSLRAALTAVDNGEVTLAAGDAIVGAYINRDLKSMRFAGQLGPATPLAVAVGLENEALSEVVRTTLDELAADGVLANIRRTWVGDLPELSVPEDSIETSETP